MTAPRSGMRSTPWSVEQDTALIAAVKEARHIALIDVLNKFRREYATEKSYNACVARVRRFRNLGLVPIFYEGGKPKTIVYEKTTTRGTYKTAYHKAEARERERPRYDVMPSVMARPAWFNEPGLVERLKAGR